MKKTLPVVVYRNGIRYVVGEAGVEVGDDLEIDWKKAEINITNPQVTEMLQSHQDGYFSIGKEN